MPRRLPPLRSVLLTALRSARGWTGQDLAAATGLSSKSISIYERERAPSTKTLEGFGAAMGYDSAAIASVELGLTLALGTPGEPLSPVEPSPEELRRLQRAAAEISLSSYKLAEEHLLRVFRELRIGQSRDTAARLWSDLKDLRPEKRRLLVETSGEHQSWALAERLCHESAEAASNRADLALELAGLALRVAELSPGSELWRWRLLGYCLAFLANALRVSNDMRGAGETFARAWELWEKGGPADPGVLAEWRVLSLEGSLRRDERRFVEAIEVLDRALVLAPREAAGRISLQKGSTLEQMGEAEEAINALREAVPLIDGRQEPRDHWVLLFNLAGSLCEAGRYLEAHELLPKVRDTAISLRKELDLIRVLWLEGKVAAGLRRIREAASGFEQVRQEFTTRVMPYDCALVSLDLAVLYLEEGRSEEVRHLAGKMTWIFKEQGIHREALAALSLFRLAVEQEEASAELARRVASYLRKAQHDPALRFEG
jgi:tetratricopeptide (TPR) repeat protein